MAAGEELPGLGLATDRPRPNATIDVSRLKLSPTEGFVLSRVDGFASYAEICRMSGLGRDKTLAILRKLKQEHLILGSAKPAPTAPQAVPPAAPTFQAGAADRRSPSPDRRSPSPDRVPPAPARPVAHDPPPAAAASELPRAAADREGPRSDARRAGATSVLERLDDGTPVDAAALTQGMDLSDETKRRITRLHRRMRKLHPHELLGVPMDADPAVVRKAFAAISKELHPDRYFGKDLGGFRDKLAQIFSRMSEAAQTLQKARKGKR